MFRCLPLPSTTHSCLHPFFISLASEWLLLHHHYSFLFTSLSSLSLFIFHFLLPLLPHYFQCLGIFLCLHQDPSFHSSPPCLTFLLLNLSGHCITLPRPSLLEGNSKAARASEGPNRERHHQHAGLHSCNLPASSSLGKCSSFIFFFV